MRSRGGAFPGMIRNMVEVWRCFVAIDLPDAGRARAVAEMEALRLVGAEIRWVREGQLHLTLKFLGDVPVERLTAVRQALRRVAAHHAPMRALLSGLGRFPPRGRPSVFWMGLDGELESVVAVAHDIDRALGELGFERERRRFHPHITLGRVRGTRHLRDLESLVAARGEELELELPPLGAFRLYRSELGPSGARHSVVEEFALGSSSAGN